MLDRDFVPMRFEDDSDSAWVRSFSLAPIKCLIVCRGPVRKEAIDVLDQVGVKEYGMLLSEKDSIVYPRSLAPELRGFRFPENVHRVPDYMGSGQEEKVARIKEIVAIAKENAYTHIFAGYGFMAEDAEFIEAIERAGLTFAGPASRVARGAGAKDEAKKLARRLGNSVTPGVDNVSVIALLARVKDQGGLEKLAKERKLDFTYDAQQSIEENAEALLQVGYANTVELVTIEELQATAKEQSIAIWRDRPESRIRYKYIGGGGGKGQRVVSSAEEVSAAVMDILAESKVVAPGSNRNFLIELNIETTRHNEIQLIGNGEWCLSLGGRDCSVQMHEQKLLEISLTDELLAAEIEACGNDTAKREVLEIDRQTLARMEEEAERFGEAVKLDSVSTWEAIVDGGNHFFMEMNTRIQVEHRVTELAYGLKFTNPENAADFFYCDSLIEAMMLLSLHGSRLPKPTRYLHNVSGAEVRINATNGALQPHAGGVIRTWSPPLEDEIRDDQGIGLRNPDTGAFVYYNLAGAYDSNIALVVTAGQSRRDNLERLAEILRRTELRGEDLQTNTPVHYGLLNWILGRDAMVKPSTRFMAAYLAGVGSVATVIRDFDVELAFRELLARHTDVEAGRVLRRKETLLVRPVQRLLANPHLTAGFIGRYDGQFWLRQGEDVSFTANPVEFLEALYHYLNLDYVDGKPASEMIWDHDESVLSSARAFYRSIEERTGQRSWDELEVLFAQSQPEQFKAEPELWQACQAAHRGFQLGMELLLVLPRIGMQAEFTEIGMDEKLNPVMPARFYDSKVTAELVKALAPPPVASSDEIVTPSGGHFYAREAPHLPLLVDEGQRFEAGQPIFIIEVMKMFNKVRAPFSGVVVKNLMKDADGRIVKKGQAIFKVLPDELHVADDGLQAQRSREMTLRLLGTPLAARTQSVS
jgi:acetyl/propionyl-CoA carboxylase alpha subunit